MRRPTQKIRDDADELARRFEGYQPRAEDERDPAQLGSPRLANAAVRKHTRQKLADLERLIVVTGDGRAGDDGFRDIQLAGLRSQAEDVRDELAELVQDGSTKT